MEQIADAVNGHDAAALKSLFSDRALEEAVDIDERVDYFFSFFPDGGLTWELDLARSSGHSTGGQQTKLVHARYTVSTGEADFILYFTDFTVNGVEDTENVGLYGLGVTPWTETFRAGPGQPFGAWDGSIDVDGHGKYGYPGIYVPPESNTLSALMFESIVGELNTKDGAGLRQKFTEFAQSDHAAEIDDGIEQLMALFPLHDAARDEAQQAVLVAREGTAAEGATLLLLSTYKVTSAKGDYRLFFADYRENAVDPSNIGIYAIGIAPWTNTGDSAAEVALAEWADSFDVDASVPPGVIVFP